MEAASSACRCSAIKFPSACAMACISGASRLTLGNGLRLAEEAPTTVDLGEEVAPPEQKGLWFQRLEYTILRTHPENKF